MNISYQVESFPQLLPDLVHHVRAHYVEVEWEKDVLSPEIDYNYYLMLDSQGFLRCVTARDDHGKLIGYLICIITHMTHSLSHEIAKSDAFFVVRDFRKAGVGVNLLQTMEDSLLESGIDVLAIGMKTKHSFDSLLVGQGFEEVERVYAKLLKDEADDRS